MHSNTILALDIGASGLKLGAFVPQRGGGLELVGYAIRELDPDPANEEQHLNELQLQLREMLLEMKVPAGRPVVLSVSGQQVFSRFVKLPPVSRDKIIEMVKFEAQQNVPVPLNEVVWDYQFLGSGGDTVDVMLAAIKTESIERIVGAVEQAGLRPELVDVAPVAVYNAVRFSYSELPPCTLVLDIGARATDLIFIEVDRIYVRSIPTGGNAITQQIAREFELPFAEAEKLKRAHAFVGLGGAYEAPASQVADKVSKTVRSVMTRLHTEITRSINFYRTQQSGQTPGLVLLTGGSSSITYTDEFLKEKLQLPVDFFNPFQNVSVSPSLDVGEVAKHAHLMGAVVGAALRKHLTCPIEINLLPPRLVAMQEFRQRQPFIIGSAIGLVVLLGLWAVGLQRLSEMSHQRLQKIRGRLQELQAVEARLKEHEDRIAQIKEYLDVLAALPPQRTQWAQILADVRSRLQDGMWIVRWTPLRAGEGSAGTERGLVAEAVAPGLPVLPGRAAPAASGAAHANVIEAIEITGYAYVDKVQQEDIVKLRDRLRESPFFDPARTDIVATPMMAKDDFVREFTLRLVLKNPIAP